MSLSCALYSECMGCHHPAFNIVWMVNGDGDGGAVLEAFAVLLLFEVLFEFVDIVWAIPSLRALCAALIWSPLSEYEFSERAFQIKKEKKFSFNIPSARSFQLRSFFSFFIHSLAHLTYSFSTETVLHFFDFYKYGKKCLEGKKNEWEGNGIIFIVIFSSFIRTSSDVLTKVR